jgi:toxin YoeB
MSLELVFTTNSWEDYIYWQKQDKKILLKINMLVKECGRGGSEGLGKAEALRGELSGYYSRRIDQKHRLIYRATKSQLVIVACRYHYGDK